MTRSALKIIGVAAVLATVSTLLATPAFAANDSVCNAGRCDGQVDPSTAQADRVASSASGSGRQLRLHADDARAMMWASVDSSQGGDQLWLDRSWNGGRSWDTGSRVVDTTVPQGSSGWRTQLINNDDWAGPRVGAVRACGSFGGAITCTPWARTTWNAGNRAQLAQTGLAMMFSRSDGRFEGNWWVSAVALSALITSIRSTGMHSYEYMIGDAYDRNIGAEAGNFTNDYMDDTGWWGNAWIDAYDLTGQQRYLDMAKRDADFIGQYWSSACGGGVLWNRTKTYKASIANSLYLKLTAALHSRIPGDTAYLQRSQATWSWMRSSGILRSDGLVADGVETANGQCSVQSTPYTYNQGELIDGLVTLNRADGDAAKLTAARTIGNAMTSSSLTTGNGILRESCDASNSCSGDGLAFKAAAIRGLGALNRALSDHPYSAFISRNADAATANDRSTLGLYGMSWAGPLGAAGVGQQASAVELLTANGS